MEREKSSKQNLMLIRQTVATLNETKYKNYIMLGTKYSGHAFPSNYSNSINKGVENGNRSDYIFKLPTGSEIVFSKYLGQAMMTDFVRFDLMITKIITHR